MDTSQNNNNSLNPPPSSPLGSPPTSAPTSGFDLSQTSLGSSAPVSIPTAPLQSPGLTPDTNFAPSITNPTSGGDLSFPSKSPWDSSSSGAPSTPSLDSSAGVTPAPADSPPMTSVQSPTPLSLPSDNQSVSLTPPTTNITPAPVDFNSLTSNSGGSQPSALTSSGTGDNNSSSSSTTWSPQSMDSTQSVPVNPQASQPMTDSSTVGGSPLPSSGFNLSDQATNSFSIPGQGASPTLTPAPDTSAMSAPTSPTDPTALPSMNMPTGGLDASSPAPAWPATSSTDSTSGSLPPVASSDPSALASTSPSSGSNPFGMEAAPTDLSHLVDSSLPSVGAPSAVVSGGGPSQFEPTSSDQPAVLTSSASLPNASISGEGGSPGLPKAIIFLVIGVLLIVAAAAAYFIGGVGKMAPAATSIPIDQHLTTPPAVPTTPASTSSSSDSATLTITPPPASSSSASSSGSAAIDLSRQNP